jgi:hypothetical protein
VANLSSVGFSGNGNDGEIDLEALRTRLRKMTDQQLRRFGLPAKFMSSGEANFGPPRQVFVIQLEEAKAEWERRKAQNFNNVYPPSRS